MKYTDKKIRVPKEYVTRNTLVFRDWCGWALTVDGVEYIRAKAKEMDYTLKCEFYPGNTNPYAPLQTPPKQGEHYAYTLDIVGSPFGLDVVSEEPGTFVVYAKNAYHGNVFCPPWSELLADAEKLVKALDTPV